MDELAHIRNKLLRMDIHTEDIEHLELIRNELNNTDFDFSKVVRYGVVNCIKDLKESNFKDAANELQLVHDIPVTKEEYECWLQRSFYKIELVDYLDNVSDHKRIKEYIQLLAMAEKNI